MSRVKSEIIGVTYFSFTTDVWSASAGGCSLLSLTAHWLTELFDKRSSVLHVQPLQQFHTGEYLGVIYKRMLDHWEISIDQGRSQPFLIGGLKLFSKSLLYTTRHCDKFWHQLGKQLATLYNERHLA